MLNFKSYAELRDCEPQITKIANFIIEHDLSVDDFFEGWGHSALGAGLGAMAGGPLGAAAGGALGHWLGSKGKPPVKSQPHIAPPPGYDDSAMDAQLVDPQSMIKDIKDKLAQLAVQSDNNPRYRQVIGSITKSLEDRKSV